MFKKKEVEQSVEKKHTYKGKKVYAIALEGRDAFIICDDLENAKRRLDSSWTHIVECTVTRVFTRERDLKEIETEI